MERTKRQGLLLALCAALAFGAVEPRAQSSDFEEPMPEATIDPVISPTVYQGGMVVVRVTVAETGAVADVNVVRPFPALTEAVVAAVRQWRFKPARLKGRVVAATTNVAVQVTLIRTVAPPAGR